MANTFRNNALTLTQSLSNIYTAPSTSGAIATVIGCSFSNKSTAPVAVDVVMLRSSTAFYIIKSGVVPVGGTLTVAGFDQKIVVQAGDSIQALATLSNSVDAIISVLEIT